MKSGWCAAVRTIQGKEAPVVRLGACFWGQMKDVKRGAWQIGLGGW